LLLAVALAMPGCGARGAALSLQAVPAPPVSAASADVWSQFAGKLPIGSAIRVRTDTRERVTATLLVVDEGGITVQPRTRVPEPARRIAFTNIAQIDVVSEKGANMAKAAAVGGAVGAGTFLGLLMVLFAGID
jgi:hypothetical protein